MKITSVNAQQISANIPKNRDISKLENIGDEITKILDGKQIGRVVIKHED